jgi:MFS family permease
VLVSVLGFAGVGLGCANLIPILFKAAANADYRHPGEAIAYVSRIGYLGFLLGPVWIGFLASQFGLLLGLATVGLCALLIALLAKRILPDDNILL